MKKIIVVSAILVSAILVACSSGGGGGGTASLTTGSTTTNGSNLTGLFSAPANPLNITLILDTALTTSATISAVAGGSLTATGSDGTVYSLVIPPKALAMETVITMTPVSSISGFSFSNGLGGAVKFEPEGLYFYKDAVLTITTPSTIPVANQIMFGFDADGNDVHLAVPDRTSSQIRIPIEHFSGVGVGNGVSAQKAAILNRLASSAENRLTSQSADIVDRMRRGETVGPSEIANLFDEYERTVLKPRMTAALSASGTCADGNQALVSMLTMQRQAQLLGAQGTNLIDYAAEIDAIARKCADEEYTICAEQHNIVRIVPFMLNMEAQSQNGAPSQAAVQYAWSLVEKCFRFDLEFVSAAQFDDGAGGGYQSSVQSTVPIRMTSMDMNFKLLMKGSPPLINKSFNWIAPGYTVTNVLGGGSFNFAELSWPYIVEKDEFVLKDFSLSYFPGTTSESFTQVNNADPKDRYTSPPTAYWTNLFILAHQDDSDPAGGYIAEKWTVQKATLIGQREWSKKFIVGPTTTEEIGSMKLFHKPGQ